MDLSNDSVSTEPTSTDTTPDAPAGGDSPTTSPASPEGAKRVHTSPRVIMGAEFQMCISSLRTKWEAEADSASKTDVLSVLGILSDSVQTLTTGGHPKGERGKPGRPAGPVNPLKGKNHYCGRVGETGEYVYINTEGKPPTPANYSTLSRVYGPFRTEDGARYCVSHPDALEGKNRVF